MIDYYLAECYRKIKNKDKYYKLLMWNKVSKKWQSCQGGSMTWNPGAEHKLEGGNTSMCSYGLHATNDPWRWREPSDPYYPAKMGLFEVTSIGRFRQREDKIVTLKMTIGAKPLTTWTEKSRLRDLFKRMRELGIYE